MPEMPELTVHIVDSAKPPSSVGERGVLPSGVSLTNAVFAATGIT